MPMPFKKATQTDGVQEETAEEQTCYAFCFRAYWFVLAQTDGEDTLIRPIPGFDIDTALCALNITYNTVFPAALRRRKDRVEEDPGPSHRILHHQSRQTPEST